MAVRWPTVGSIDHGALDYSIAKYLDEISVAEFAHSPQLIIRYFVSLGVTNTFVLLRRRRRPDGSWRQRQRSLINHCTDLANLRTCVRH